MPTRVYAVRRGIAVLRTAMIAAILTGGFTRVGAQTLRHTLRFDVSRLRVEAVPGAWS